MMDHAPHSPSNPSPEPTRTERGAAAPSRAELAQWKSETDQFLRDVERRLNGILRALGGEAAAAPARTPQAEPFDPEVEPTPARPAAGGDDRISALKAQLARKLHHFDGSSQDRGDHLPGEESRP